MFSARRRVPANRLYASDALERLGQNLREAGFDRITVKLPHNLVGMENSEIPLHQFLERQRNYPSVILVAVNAERGEILKVLFVNISRKTFFIDDTFPSGHSEPSQLFVQSPDPARLYALTGFFSEYFRSSGRRTQSALTVLAYLAAVVVLMAEFLSVAKGSGFILSLYPSLALGVGLDVGIFALSMYVVFSVHRTRTGLYINPAPNYSLWTLASRAVQGQVMDNPLVSLVVTVIAGIITALILKLLGLL